MPYIHQEIKDDRELLIQCEHEPGVLTYQIQQAIQNFLLAEDVSYARLAAVLGCLEGAKADFIDRVLLPYEHVKCKDNGDVWQTSLTN